MESQTATPYQAQLHQERVDRLKRIKSGAVADSEISLPRAKRGVNGEQLERLSELRRQAVFIGNAIEAIENNSGDVVVGAVNICDQPAISLEPVNEVVPIITVRDIQRAICLRFHISMTDLLSPMRTRSLIRPRHIAMYLARKMTGRSLPDIGRKFGDRDHTTILNAVDKISDLIAKDAEMAREVEHMTGSIYGTAATKGRFERTGDC